MKLEFDYSKSIILIDSSYYVFYRYFATLRWFTFQKKIFDPNTIMENEEYIQCFIKHLKSDINKIARKWKTDKNNIVFCNDCQRCNIWRNDLYSDYKGNRVANENFNGEIFNIFNQVITDMSIYKISFDRLEADDIVYLLQNKLKQKKVNIVIITNDNDYLQMIDKNVEIYNMQMKDISSRGQCNPVHDLYQKILFGDKSDNIVRISPTITKEKSIELSKMPLVELKKWIKKENLTNEFELNLKLISFECIPKIISDDFYKSLTIS